MIQSAYCFVVSFVVTKTSTNVEKLTCDTLPRLNTCAMKRIERLQVQLDTVECLVTRLKQHRTFNAEDDKMVTRFKLSLASSLVDLFVMHLNANGFKDNACAVQRVCHGLNPTTNEYALDHLVNMLISNHIYNPTIERCLTSFVMQWFPE